MILLKSQAVGKPVKLLNNRPRIANDMTGRIPFNYRHGRKLQFPET